MSLISIKFTLDTFKVDLEILIKISQLIKWRKSLNTKIIQFLN